MSACIIPVAPDFHDPPSDPDSPPYIYNPQPQNFFTIVTVPVPAGQSFSANVTDPNVGDTLQYRWVVDYPPFMQNVTRPGNLQTILPTADGQPINQTVTPQQIDCLHVDTAFSTHQLELIVTDGAFIPASDPTLTPSDVLDSIDPSRGGFVVRAGWTVVISCPAGQ